MTRGYIDWTPILKWGLEQVKALEYAATSRWTFYRIVGKFGLPKSAYKLFLKASGTRRKEFKEGWTPHTLKDDSRSVTTRGDGASTYTIFKNWYGQAPDVDVWDLCPIYVEAWVEADAMIAQFKHLLEGITLRPLKGDWSIDGKWIATYEIADRLDDGKEIFILYFGDCDKKGREIPVSAWNQIRQWLLDETARCLLPGEVKRHPEIEFIYAGLTKEQALKFKLVESIGENAQPGEYQWESLSDAQAREIIKFALAKIPLAEVEAAREEAQARRNDWTKRYFKELMAKLKGGPPDVA